MATVEFSKEEVLRFLDARIDFWRKEKSEPVALPVDETIDNERHKLICSCYIDAYQSMRVSIFGELLPPKSNEQS